MKLRMLVVLPIALLFFFFGPSPAQAQCSTEQHVVDSWTATVSADQEAIHQLEQSDKPPETKLQELKPLNARLQRDVQRLEQAKTQLAECQKRARTGAAPAAAPAATNPSSSSSAPSQVSVSNASSADWKIDGLGILTLGRPNPRSQTIAGVLLVQTGRLEGIPQNKKLTMEGPLQGNGSGFKIRGYTLTKGDYLDLTKQVISYEYALTIEAQFDNPNAPSRFSGTASLVKSERYRGDKGKTLQSFAVSATHAPGIGPCPADKVQIVDEKTGKDLPPSPTLATALVAVRTRLAVKLVPADRGAKYQWEIGGTRIKKYQHRMDDPGRHKTFPLQGPDLQDDNVSFFWQRQGDSIPVTITVTASALTCTKTVNFKVSQDPDVSLNIYTKDDDKDRSPDFKVLEGHAAWHGFHQVNGEDPPFSKRTWGEGKLLWGDTVDTTVDPGTFGRGYHGSAFLLWHQAVVESYRTWRQTFGLGTAAYIGPNPPPGTLAINEYLKKDPDPGSAESSRVYHYVRLGEFQDLDQLGRDVVAPWHNMGHMNISAATGFSVMGTFQSPGSPQDTFWKWHTIVDSVRRAWKVDQASVTRVFPAENTTVRQVPISITITFDRRVSMSQDDPGSRTRANIIGITPDKLTVNGSPATEVVDAGLTSKFRQYKFAGFVPPQEGTIVVELKGTASYKGKRYKYVFKRR